MLTAILLRKRRRATYMLQSSASSISEGQPITFTLNTTKVPNGTLVPYTISGVSSADIGGASLTGNFTVGATGTATLPITFSNDLLTEGSETFTLTLNNLGISLSVTIDDTSTTPITWYQKGSLLTETSPNVGGYGVSVSADGNVVVSTGRTSTSSFISVNRWINYAWVNTKITIPVHSPGNAELQTSISDDGNVIACVYRNHQFEFPSGNSPNYAAVYAWNGSSWNQRGNSFVTTSPQDSAVAISGNGLRVAITDDRQVKVYSWNNSNSVWYQDANTIVNELTNDFGWGKHISLDYTGQNIAINRQSSSTDPYVGKGIIIFTYTFNQWVRVAFFNAQYSIDALFLRSTTDNKTVLAFATYDSLATPFGAHIQVYKTLTESLNSNWINRGRINIDGPTAFLANPNISMSINKDGNRVIWSTKQNYNVNGDSTNSTIHIVDWNGTNWQQTGTITPDPSNSNNGYSIALSQDGQTIAFGAPNYNKVTVFETYTPQYPIDQRLLENLSSRLLESNNIRLLELGSGGNINTSLNWVQFGSDLVGEGSEDNFGHSISLNAVGNVIAVGAFNNSAGKGSARIFSRSGNSWVQRGLDIDGTSTNDEFGRSISLNAVGDRVAISAPGSSSGYTRVYSWDGSSWVKLGQDLIASGNIVLNDVGNLVVASNKAYSWNGSSWTQVGNDIFNGFISGAASNSTGTRVVLGNQGFGSYSVRVFDWDGNSWIQVGENFNTQQIDSYLGTTHTIDINSEGNRIILGAPGFNKQSSIDNGLVRIYDWDGNSWVQVGQDITGVANEYFGENVGMDAIGNRIIIGSTGIDNRSGKAVVYEWNGTFWVQIFQITGSVQSFTGRDVDISSNGRTIAIGDRSNDQRGKVKIYDFESMSFIPQGSFTMGDSLDGIANATPTRAVTLDGFYICKYEVSRGEWNEVRTWGLTNGYTDLASEIPMAPSMGFGAASNHPIGYVTWFDAVKWCNARSQKEGLIPIYYTDIAQTTVYKTGNTNLPSTHVKWDANGYRLPTEAEWEKAARGGLNGKRYPLGDTITRVEANYMNFTGQGGADRPNTTAVGTFPPNSYGLYDMAGNISELCWDYYAESYNPTDLTNPRGPTSGINFNSRVVRGGSWASTNTTDVGVALRNGGGQPGSSNTNGFRVVRSKIN